MKTPDLQQLESLASRVAGGLGYELVDLAWKHEGGSWLLRVFIDHATPAPRAAEEASAPSEPGDRPRIGHDDCTRVSRALSAELDVADLIPVAFTLEVSSPGLDRPLKREADFRRFAGRAARIRTRHPLPQAGSTVGRRNFAGSIVSAGAGKVRIDVDGTVYEVPVDDIEKANLHFQF